MKKIFLLPIILLSPISMAFADNCNYSSIDGIEYRVTDNYAKYVKNDFDAFPNAETHEQGDLKDYISLIKNPFKVTSTNETTLSSRSYKTYLSDYRFSDVVIDNQAYITDEYYTIEVTTSDCQKFYFSNNGEDLESMQYNFERADSKPITTDNYFEFMGDTVQKRVIQTSSEYDKFEGEYLVKTDYFDQYLLRGYWNKAEGKYSLIQLYLNSLAFTGDDGNGNERSWSNIQYAKDTEANTHKVTQIDQSIDCSPRMLEELGCTLYETIGVQVSEDFLRKHQDGFEIKLVGTHSFVKKISGDVVKAFLDETDLLKKSS